MLYANTIHNNVLRYHTNCGVNISALFSTNYNIYESNRYSKLLNKCKSIFGEQSRDYEIIRFFYRRHYDFLEGLIYFSPEVVPSLNRGVTTPLVNLTKPIFNILPDRRCFDFARVIPVVKNLGIN